MTARQPLTGLQLAASSVVLTSYAQLAQKWGMTGLPPLASWQQLAMQPTAYTWQLAAVCSGLLAYAISMVCWLGALQYLPLNRAYPILGLSYGLVYIGSVVLPWYHEGLTLRGVVGCGLVVAGVALINLRRR